MTRDELDQEIARLTALRDALKKEWPQERDRIFALTQHGEIIDGMYDAGGSWPAALERGLIFRTREEAERADKKRIAIAEWNRRAPDQSKINWGNISLTKYAPYYDYSCKIWRSGGAEYSRFWPFAHHETRKACEAAIAAMGEMMDWLLY